MRKKIEVTVKKPQFSVTTDVSFAQVDAWYGHTRMDLKMDIIYPEDDTRLYPCVVWVCGGAWMKMDKSAHLAYLSRLARKGFVVASVQYRTSNEEPFCVLMRTVTILIRSISAFPENLPAVIWHVLQHLQRIRSLMWEPIWRNPVHFRQPARGIR